MSRPVKQHQTPTWLKMSISVVHFTDLVNKIIKALNNYTDLKSI